MKHALHWAALLLVACLISCHQQPKVAEPIEWNFDLLWKVAQALPDDARLGDFGQASSMDQVRKSYTNSPDKNTNYMFWWGEDQQHNACSSHLICYQYTGLNKLLAVYSTSYYADGKNHDQQYYYDYDLKKGKVTPVALPIQPLGFKDFFDGILLADQTPAKIRAYEEEGEVVYVFGEEDADLLTYFMIPSEAYLPDFEMGLSDRENRLMFDWDGKSFVHHPEKDWLGYAIYEDGFCSLDFESEIPEQLEGFEIERQTYMEEDREKVKYVITQEGTLVMEIKPVYDFSKDEFTNTIEVIDIYSDRYQTFGEFHVGSTFSELMDTYGDYANVLLSLDELLMLDVEGIQFMFDFEDYQGNPPTVVTVDAPILLEPSIRPEAKVKMIRLYPVAVG